MKRKILIIGGNRFFGKRLAHKLIENGDEVSVLNRGNTVNDFENKAELIICDRKNKQQLKQLVGHKKWDVVYDQVCYDASESYDAVEVFSSIASKYIFTSSMSVYDGGADLAESDFDPFKHQFNFVADPQKEYAEAKRQCETVFYKQQNFNICAVRFPIVMGSDDYTNRLRFYIDKIKNNEEIVLPNLNAKMSFVHAADAAQALFDLGRKDWFKPINVTAAEPMKVSDLVLQIAKVLNKPIQLKQHNSPSPYGISDDFFANTELAVKLGLQIRPIASWLDSLILES